MSTKYKEHAERTPKNPPHVSLRNLRRASGLTLDQVCTAVSDGTGGRQTLSRGALSAIESGLRGASRQTLDALAIAYGLEPGDITTDFTPRSTTAGAA